MTKKILSIVGARPQFIKEAALQKALQDTDMQEVLVHSGQHYDLNMSDIFFSTLQMRTPDYFLNIGSGRHGEITGKMMGAVEEIMLKERPDLVLVYGDTNTTLAGALAAVKLKLPIAHVEAGIRQEPKDMPEEINRVLTDRTSNWLFCVSDLAKNNLAAEGITKGVFVTGDIMLDIYQLMQPQLTPEIYMQKYDLQPGRFVIATIHRDFNTDHPAVLKKIVDGLNEISKDFQVVFPVHPRTAKVMAEHGIQTLFPCIPPIDYLELQSLTLAAKAVITDSGGYQKEAYFANKRAVVVMPDTGWRELVQAGWNVLATPDSITSAFEEVLRPAINVPSDIYGTGATAREIVRTLSL